MKQREWIDVLEHHNRFLEASLKETSENLRVTTESLNRALARIDSLLEEIQSLKEALLVKGESLEKEKAVNKGLRQIMRNESEVQKPVVPEKSEEEKKAEQEKKEAERKARGNNGAKRDRHLECETQYVDVYPDTEGADAERIREIGWIESTRYSCVPMKIIKTVYRLHKYAVEGSVVQACAPTPTFFNSSYDASFVATMLELRHKEGMPVERIIDFFSSNGFKLAKPTAHNLLKIASTALEPLYLALQKAVLEDPYLGCDETYSLVKLEEADEKSKTGKKIKKGYVWVAIGHNTGLVYFFYSEGSRKKDVFIDFIKGYNGIIQTDGLHIYRKTGSEEGNGIVRISCIQHIKREFLDLKGNPDADELFSLCNLLYHNEHMHRIGTDGWTADDNLKWRQEYAPPILAKLRERLTALKSDPKIPPKSAMAAAVTYAFNEMDDVDKIFRYGFTDLDNNDTEVINRCISMHRRSSLFFGSHAGARRHAIFFSLMCSCRRLGINFRQYMIDTLEAAALLPPVGAQDRWRDLLPDRYLMRLGQ